MKITIIIPQLIIGGTENYAIKLCNGLVSRGFNIELICTSPRVDAVFINGLDKKVRLIVRQDSGDNLFEIYRWIKPIIKASAPDLIYGLMDVGNLLLIPFFRRKIIASRRYNSKRLKGRPIRKFLLNTSIRLSSCVIKNSDSILVRKKINAFTVPNCVETNPFHKNGNEKIDLPIKILTVSNLRKEKGINFLLKCISKLSIEEQNRMHFTIIGDGDSYFELNEFVIAEKLPVTLLGAVANAREIMNKFDVYLHPSHTEGFSNSIIEAMQAGLPVFASNVGSAKDSLGDEKFLFDPGNHRELINILKSISSLMYPFKEMGQANLKRVSDLFSCEKMINSHVDIFTKILGKK